MRQTCRNKTISPILCIVLIVAMALFTAGCGRGNDSAAVPEAVIQTDGQVLGTGGTVFQLLVVDAEGGEIHAEIHTDQTIVGEALKELGVIAGEDSPTGIYVKTVNGITADYDADGSYWAFYVGEDYAQTGVDSTEITEGADYAFKVERA